MTTRDDASALVKRLQECFNTRQFDQADDLHTPNCFSHPLGTTGFEAGKDARRWRTAQFPHMPRLAHHIPLDGDKGTVRPSVAGTATPACPPAPFPTPTLP